MDVVTKEIFNLLQYLLPGLLASWVFFGITPFAKPSPFERIVQALIFTLIIQFTMQFVELSSTSCPQKISFSSLCKTELIWSTIFALVYGLAFAVLVNKDWLHSLLRKLLVTKQTSYPSEWYGVLNSKVTYIVLHLRDERRLYGWPLTWPESPSSGHFYIVEASWLSNNGDELYLPAGNVEGVLIDIAEVRWVEIMKKETV